MNIFIKQMFQNKVAQNKTLIIAVAFVAIGVVGYMLPAANVASAQYYDYYPSDYGYSDTYYDTYDYYPSDYEYTNTYYDTYDYYPSDYGYSDTYYDTYDYYPSDYGYSDDYYPSDYGYDNYDCVNCYGGGGYTPPSYNYPTGCGSSCGSTYQPPVYQPPVYQYPTYTYPSNTNIINSGNSDDDTIINTNYDNDTIINSNVNTNTNIIGNTTGYTPCTTNCPPPPCTTNCYPQPTYPPTVDLRVDDNIVDEGDSTTLRWTSNYANSCYASGDWSGSKSTNSSQSTGSLFSTRSYHITCTGPGGQASDSVTVTVRDNNDDDDDNNDSNVTVTIRADDTLIDEGDSTILRWNSTNADYCLASQDWSGTKDEDDSESTGRLFDDQTYRITCYNNSDSDSDSVTVRVEDININPGRVTTTVVTEFPTGVSQTQATLNGFILNSQSMASTVWFEWGTSANFLGFQTPETSIGNIVSSPFARSITGLSANTTYFYRAVARTSAGTVRGAILSFSTPTGQVAGDVFVPFVPSTGTASVSVTKKVENISTPNGSSDRVSAWAGNQLRFTIVVENTGSRTLTNLKVTDELPTYIEYVRGGTLGSDGRAVTWTIDRLTAGETRTLTLDTTMSACSTGAAIENHAKVSGSQISTVTSNAATILLNQGDLEMTIRTDKEFVQRGDEVNYTVTLTNNSTANLTGGQVRVALPNSLTFQSADNAYTEGSNVFTFNIDSIAAGATKEIHFVVEVNRQARSGESINLSAVATFGNTTVSANKTITVGAGNGAAGVGFAGFFPGSLVGWLLIIILLVVLALLVRKAFFSHEKEQEAN